MTTHPRVTAADMARDRLHPRPYPCYVFDLDGTVYLGDELLPGARRLIEAVRARGAGTVFLSNNPTRDPEAYAEKLTRLGLPTPQTHVVTPLALVASWIQREVPGGSAFVIGEEPLKQTLEAAGVSLCEDPERVDVVVASYDRGFDYRKLRIAFDALWQHRRARLIATNPDPYCPLPGGRGEPDAAAVVAAIEASTGVRCEATLGKPSAAMLSAAARVAEVPVTECLMVGDRLSTDIAMAADCGADSALVLTGEATRAEAESLPPARRPSYIVERIDALLPR